MPQPIARWNPARDVWEILGTEGLLCEHLDVFWETFPNSGTWADGVAYELPTSVPRTDGSASSLLLPTPLSSTQDPSQREISLGDPKRRLPTVIAVLLPTPEANTASNGGSQHPDKRRAGGHSVNLQDVIEHL